MTDERVQQYKDAFYYCWNYIGSDVCQMMSENNERLTVETIREMVGDANRIRNCGPSNMRELHDQLDAEFYKLEHHEQEWLLRQSFPELYREA